MLRPRRSRRATALADRKVERSRSVWRDLGTRDVEWRRRRRLLVRRLGTGRRTRRVVVCIGYVSGQSKLQQADDSYLGEGLGLEEVPGVRPVQVYNTSGPG